MPEIASKVHRKHGKTYLEPLAQYADEAAKWPAGSIVRARYAQVRKHRSLDQLNTLWACAALVAYNCDDEMNWSTKEKVIESCKWTIGFVDHSCTIVRKDGAVIMRTKSLSFRDLDQQEANKVVDQLLDVMARKLGTDVETLIAEAKELMG